MGTIKDTAGKLDLAGKSNAELIKTLAAKYDEIQPELAEMMRKFKISNKFLEDLKLPRAHAWAAMVVSIAEALDLDLDTAEGLAAAVTLAEFQINLS